MTSMKWNRNGTSVRVIPAFVTSCLAGSRKPKLSRSVLQLARSGARHA